MNDRANNSLQATRDGALSSASRITSFGPAYLISELTAAQRQGEGKGFYGGFAALMLKLVLRLKRGAGAQIQPSARCVAARENFSVQGRGQSRSTFDKPTTILNFVIKSLMEIRRLAFLAAWIRAGLQKPIVHEVVHPPLYNHC
jgi:hypothetical protein